MGNPVFVFYEGERSQNSYVLKLWREEGPLPRAENGNGQLNLYSNKDLTPYPVPALPEFEEWEWFDAAIETKVIGLKDKKIPQIMTIFKDKTFWRKDTKKETTHWYRFQEAVKDHERLGVNLLSPVFKKMGVNFQKNSLLASVG